MLKDKGYEVDISPKDRVLSKKELDKKFKVKNPMMPSLPFGPTRLMVMFLTRRETLKFWPTTLLALTILIWRRLRKKGVMGEQYPGSS